MTKADFASDQRIAIMDLADERKVFGANSIDDIVASSDRRCLQNRLAQNDAAE